MNKRESEIIVDFLQMPEVFSTSLPFSPAARIGKLLFVSGQASTDVQGRIIPDSFEGEFRRSMENMRKVLNAAGSDLKRVAMVRAYVRDPANLPLYNLLYKEYFSEPYPARTTLTGCLPESLHFEIDCVAVIDDIDQPLQIPSNAKEGGY